MAIRIDPENAETNALFGMVNFSGQHVLEIGCGDGRFTWRYADRAEHVTAIEPAANQLLLAREHLPSRLRDQVELLNIAFAEFAAASPPSVFDIVILSWSLC